MAWYWQLDNEGKRTDYRRFFNENEERAMKNYAAKRKRIMWEAVTEKEMAKVDEIAKPTKSITFVDVENANTIEELNALLEFRIGNRTKGAIKKKIESLTNKNENNNE